jgi:hypothetical protein
MQDANFDQIAVPSPVAFVVTARVQERASRSSLKNDLEHNWACQGVKKGEEEKEEKIRMRRK